uniref:ABC transporter domain-containing protein n=1 Tax=Panagrellus redivivus TaxID=6233 RepID=A0A7E4ZVH3_PANRE
MQPMMFGVESVPCYATLGHRQPVTSGMMDRRGFHAWTLQRPHTSNVSGQHYLHLPPTVYEEPDDKAISSASSHGGASTSPLIMAVPHHTMMPSRVPSLTTDRFRSLARPPKLGVSAFQGSGLPPQRRFVRSDWDIRPVAATDDHLAQFGDAHSNNIAYTASSADGTSEVDSGEPSPRLPLGLSIGDGFLRSQRHHGHYFSNADLFVQPIAPRYNYLKYAKASDFDGMGSVPHLRIIDFGFELDARTLFDKAMLRSNEATVILDGVTFELFGGDTCALMYTSETEVTAFMRIIANANPPRGQVSGSLELNGHNLRSRQLGDRIAFASADPPPPSLTAGEYLDFYSRLVGPATNAVSRRRLIDQLIHGLALGPLRNRLCKGLSSTELARLKLAAKMCLDTDILVADNLLTDMDLYDAAFVIDYIRDWAQRFNRIVIMACVPPTTELLTMFRKCAILSSGRLVYFGESDSMCEYFESIGFPSPPLKNPCDYYGMLL